MKANSEEKAHAVMILGAGICSFSFIDQATLAQAGFRSRFISSAHLLQISVDSIVSPVRDERLDSDARTRNFTQVQQQLLEPQWKELFALSYHIELFWMGCVGRMIQPGSTGFNELVTTLQGYVVRGALERKEIKHLVRLAKRFATGELSPQNYGIEVGLLRDALARRVVIGHKPNKQSRGRLVLRGLLKRIPYLGPALDAVLYEPAPENAPDISDQVERELDEIYEPAPENAPDISDQVERELDEIVDMYSQFSIMPPQGNTALILNSHGIVYLKLKENKKAEQLFLKAIELWPECADAYHNLGALYYENGNMEKAEKMFQKEKDLKESIPKYVLRDDKRKEFREQFRESVEQKYRKKK